MPKEITRAAICISAGEGDQDFPAVFRHMVVLSCYLMPEYYRDELDQPYVTGSVFPELNSGEFEETLEEF